MKLQAIQIILAILIMVLHLHLSLSIDLPAFLVMVDQIQNPEVYLTTRRCNVGQKIEHLSSTSLARESQGLAQRQVRVSFRREVGFADRHRF